MRSWLRDMRELSLDADRDVIAHSTASVTAERDVRTVVDTTLSALRETSTYQAVKLVNLSDKNKYAEHHVDPCKHVFTPSGAEVYVDGVFVGFASGETYPLTLAGVSLSDGDHTVEVRPSKRFWPATRTGSVFNVRVATGTTATRYVTVDSLQAFAFENRCRVTWNVVDDGVTYTRFKLVVKAGSAPVYTDTATAYVDVTAGLKAYTWWTSLPTSTSYVGVFPFNVNTFVGETNVTVVMPLGGAPASPADQWAHNDRTGRFEFNSLP